MKSIAFLRDKFQSYYDAVAARIVVGEQHVERRNLQYWKNQLFSAAIFYLLPLSLLSLVPSVIFELAEDHLNIAVFDVVSVCITALLAFNQSISLHLRKVLLASQLALVAIVMMAFMGSFTLGMIYLFLLSVFVALQFSDRAAFGVIGLNLLCCAVFAIALRYRPVDLPMLYQHTSFNRWVVVHSFNFLFVDLVIVILIRHLLNGFDRTMIKKADLYEDLANELKDKNVRSELLRESEVHYRTLFFHSPQAMLIFDLSSFNIIQVNKAAVRSYGYSEDELLQMKLDDIHPESHGPEILRQVKAPFEQSPVLTRHLRKDGTEIDVELRRSDMLLGGKSARLVIVSDITKQVRQLYALRQQNKKLQEIAFMQSHVVRVPVANIIRITDLIRDADWEGEGKVLLDYLDRSVKQLDEIVSHIVQEAEDDLSE